MQPSDLYGFLLQLLDGAWITIQVAVGALLLGLVLGLLGAAAEVSRHIGLRMIATTFISIIRGLPELLVIFAVYFGGTALLTMLVGHYVSVSAFVAGIVALGLLFGSYASQTFRGAFLAVPVSQAEAARALGLSRWQIFSHIQLPQAWRHALPGLSNLWLVLLKDTALISLIGLADLMNKAQTAASTTHQPFTFYFAAACFYVLVTSLSQVVLRKISRKANQHVIT